MQSKLILGIDEVGRGPWAGPLVVGAVILPLDETKWSELTDSKKLTPKRREELNQKLMTDPAVHHNLGWVMAEEIDEYGLSASLRLATRRAVKPLLASKARFDEIVIDGTVNFLTQTPLEKYVSTLKKADLLVKSVSAAAIMAKVARDRFMYDLEEIYPGYGFERHVGYGTAAHRAALVKLGICPEHRRSFKPIQQLIRYDLHALEGQTSMSNTPVNLAKKLPEEDAITIKKGRAAERQVERYLQHLGHQIVAKNYRTRFYEIDLISTQDGTLYFTEVKYSQFAGTEGCVLARINQAKLRRMRLAATDFCKTHTEFSAFQPTLAVAGVTGSDFRVESWFPLVD